MLKTRRYKDRQKETTYIKQKSKYKVAL